VPTFKSTRTVLECVDQARREGRIIREMGVGATVAGVSVAAVVPAEMPEEDFAKVILGVAKDCGWRTAHFRPARTAKGWRTAVAGDGKGFPDLILIRKRPARIIVAELKSGTGRTTPEQAEWLDAFEAVGIEQYTWVPADWPDIFRILTERAP
jgi:hypothetical protein